MRVAGLAGISSNLAREVVIRSFKSSSDLVKVNTSAAGAASTLYIHLYVGYQVTGHLRIFRGSSASQATSVCTVASIKRVPQG